MAFVLVLCYISNQEVRKAPKGRRLETWGNLQRDISEEVIFRSLHPHDLTALEMGLGTARVSNTEATPQ